MSEEKRSPIASGWRGNINGFVECTRTEVAVATVELRLDRETAYALCNLLHDKAIESSGAVEGTQIQAMSNLGAAIGRLLDHSSANNGGRKVVK